jgi:hypothetical protein
MDFFLYITVIVKCTVRFNIGTQFYPSLCMRVLVYEYVRRMRVNTYACVYAFMYLCFKECIDAYM